MPLWDLGDLVVDWTVRSKCCRRLKLVWRIGHPEETDESDRVIKGPPYATPTGRIDVVMDLQADKKVTLTTEYQDEVGNPTGETVATGVTYTVDDPTIINLTDNGDGSAVAAATGTPGTANVHVDATVGGQTLAGDLQIIVVPGDAARVAVVAGEPEEVTPDDTTPTPTPTPPPPTP